MKLSVTIYSFARYFKEGKMDVEGFINYCAQLGVDGVDLGYYWKGDEEMERARRLLREKGLGVGYIVGNDFAVASAEARQKEMDKVKLGIDQAKKLGASVVRIFAGNAKEGINYNIARPWILQCLKDVASYAGKYGITLALENHGRLAGKAEQILDFIHSVDSPYLKANIDTGNFLGVGEDPVASIKKLAPYASLVHVKDVKKAGEKSYMSCIVGEGIVDFKAIFTELKKVGYDGYLSLEYEAQEDNKIGVERSIKHIKKILQEIKA